MNNSKYWEAFREAFRPRKGGYKDLCDREKALLREQVDLEFNRHPEDDYVKNRKQEVASALNRIQKEKRQKEWRVK